MLKTFLNFFSIILLSGCAILEPKPYDSTLLEPSAIVKFSDIPVPAGFTLLPKSSYSFETTGTRVGMLKYQGKATRDQLVAFYKGQMEMLNWNLLNIVEYGDCQLNFDRDAETCVVTLSPKGSSFLITVTLGPKNQVVHKKVEKPLK